MHMVDLESQPSQLCGNFIILRMDQVPVQLAQGESKLLTKIVIEMVDFDTGNALNEKGTPFKAWRHANGRDIIIQRPSLPGWVTDVSKLDVYYNAHKEFGHPFTQQEKIIRKTFLTSLTLDQRASWDIQILRFPRDWVLRAEDEVTKGKEGVDGDPYRLAVDFAAFDDTTLVTIGGKSVPLESTHASVKLRLVRESTNNLYTSLPDAPAAKNPFLADLIKKSGG